MIFFPSLSLSLPLFFSVYPSYFLIFPIFFPIALITLLRAFDNLLVGGAAVDTAIARSFARLFVHSLARSLARSAVPFRFPLRSLANVYTEARTRTRCTAQPFAHPLVPRLLLFSFSRLSIFLTCSLCLARYCKRELIRNACNGVFTLTFI